MKLKPTVFAANHGYDITGVKAGGTEAAVFTLEKEGRKLVIDQGLIDDIQSAVSPIENSKADSPIKAVG